jgi:xanthine dehydrogenase YagR molybdenum-binding subunit
VAVGNGRIHRCDDPGVGERYTDVLARHGLDEPTADAEATPPSRDVELANSGPFAAKFVEVRVDEDLGLIRVARITTAVDAGRILNEKTARSHIIGGTIGGIGQALFEENMIDPGTGCVTSATFGDYLIPVNADAPDIDVVFVGEPDPLTPLGAKGRRRDRPRRHRRCHRQRGPSRHRSTHPLDSDHPRPPAVTRITWSTSIWSQVAL